MIKAKINRILKPELKGAKSVRKTREIASKRSNYLRYIIRMKKLLVL